ncbi:MAG: outer membrane protein assembly factor BamB family protein, partial [Dehalococcoidia bacterium]
MFKTKKYVNIILILSILLLVFVAGCSLSGGGGCSGTAAQGWSGFTPYKQVLCFGSIEGKVIAFDPQARSDNKTFPADNEWVYQIKIASPGAACGPMCSPSSSATGLGIYDTPVSVNDLIYVGSYNGKIYAINAAKGAVRWVYPREGTDSVGAIVGNMITDGKSLYFGSSDSKIYSLDAVTGDFNWDFQTSSKIWTGPAIDNGVVYAGNYGGDVYAISADTGKQIWTIKIPSAVSSSITVANDTLYFGTFDRYLYALDKTTGQEKWKATGDNWFWAQPLASGGKLYAACLDQKLYAFDPATGQPLWQFTADAPIVAPPVTSGNNLYTTSDKGTLY